MNSDTLKSELGRIRGAITSGSFDRDTALDALDKAEKALDEPNPGTNPIAGGKSFFGGPAAPAEPLTKAEQRAADKEAAKG